VKLHPLNAKSKESKLPERKYTFRETHNGKKKSIKHDPVTQYALLSSDVNKSTIIVYLEVSVPELLNDPDYVFVI